MHYLNNVSNDHGLSTLLTAEELNKELIGKTVTQAVEPNLDILPSGPKVPNPANLFSSVEMRNLLEQLNGLYTHIIIDSPPTLYFADSVILATNVEAVVLIARANFSSREVLIRARKSIQDVRGNIVGIVLNDIAVGSNKYYRSDYSRQLETEEGRNR